MVRKTSVTPRAAPRTVKRDVLIHVPVEDICRHAYQLFQDRGGQHGHDLEDWFLAEAELREGHRTSVASPSAHIQRRLG